MRAFELRRQNGAITLYPVMRDKPEPGPGEVRIRVEAVSLNYRDLRLRRFTDAMNGRIPLSDGAGHIDAVGTDVSRWRVGDRVVASYMPAWKSGRYKEIYASSALGGKDVDGTLAEFMVLPQDALLAVPSSLTTLEAATLPCAAVSAWHALVPRGGLTVNDTVLLQGTGGVSLFALQIATAIGARVIITSSSDEKLARAKDMGAAVGINYRTTPEWDVAVLDATGGEGVSHVVEVNGGETYNRSLKALGAGGKLAQIAMITAADAPDLSRVQYLNADIHGIMVGSREHLQDLIAFMDEHRIKPVVDRVFDFEESEAAHGYLQSGQHFGKIVIRI